jgi:hypothetical protein
MKQLKLLLIIPLILFGTMTSVAQVTTSNIKGVVVDESNQPFSGANVVAVHTPSGTKFGAITNFDGRYNILNMRVGGPYSVTISYLGYKSQTFDDVYLSLGKTNTIDAAMVVESEELEAVVIEGTGGTGTFGSDRTGAETNVGRRELTRLPSITRSAADFTRLEPTASNGSF